MFESSSRKFENKNIKSKKKKGKFKILIAPFEADSQLAWMHKKKLVDVVISNDSDLLVYGVRRLLMYADSNLSGFHVDSRRLSNSDLLRPKCPSQQMFRLIWTLSGCDYYLKKNEKNIFEINKQLNEQKCVFKFLGEFFKLKSESHVIEFIKAFLIFKFARVFCPISRKLILSEEIPNLKGFGDAKIKNVESFSEFMENCVLEKIETENLEKVCFMWLEKCGANLDFLGKKVNPADLAKIVNGKINPHDGEPFSGKFLSGHRSIFEQIYNDNRMKNLKVHEFIYLKREILKHGKAHSIEKIRDFETRKNKIKNGSHNRNFSKKNRKIRNYGWLNLNR